MFLCANPFAGIPTTATHPVARDPKVSNRNGYYSGEFEEKPHALEWTPDYQYWASDCMGCGQDLHYSSGWGRRVCLLCGYMEGIGGHHVYPTALPLAEWLFVVGQIQAQYSNQQMDYTEFRDELRRLTLIGSADRPYGEEQL